MSDRYLPFGKKESEPDNRINHKVKLLLLVAGIALTLRIAFHSYVTVRAGSPPAGPGAETERAIRRSTLQMALYEFDRGRGVEAGGRGLATLVQRDGRRLIVTHDHWTHLNDNLREVELRDAQGNLLLSLPAAAFNALIRHRDGGTLIMAAPPELEHIPGAPIDPAIETGAVRAGDVLWVVRRAAGPDGPATTSIDIVGARVERSVTDDALPQLALRGADGAAVLPGDSGGGVWLGTQLVGAVWSGGVAVRTTWLGRLVGYSQQTQTNLIAAALLPDGLAAPFTQSAPATGRANPPEQ